MKTFTTTFLLTAWAIACSSQTTPVYLNFVTHNELTDPIDYDTSPIGFTFSTQQVENFADLIVDRQAAWNFQTCSKYLLGVINFQNAYNDTSDILEWMDRQEEIEVDPRGKTSFFYPYNIADAALLLDSIGLGPRFNVGGFLANPPAQQDWTHYNEDSVTGAVFPHFRWQPEVLSGGGSVWHTDDDYTFGVWKPQDSINFHVHEPANRMWCLGRGCNPRLDGGGDPNEVVDEVRGIVDKITLGALPSNRFYTLTIGAHQTDFSTIYIQQIQAIIDSLQPLVDEGKIVWATISQKMEYFHAWSALTGNTHSVYDCNNIPSRVVARPEPPGDIVVFPNPARQHVEIESANSELKELTLFNQLGQEVKKMRLTDETFATFNLTGVMEGFYILQIKTTKEEIVTKKLWVN